jgi:hypothetical protein
MRPVAPFDASLGLGAVGVDHLDAEGGHGTGKVGEVTILAVENATAVGVKALGQAVALAVGLEGAHAVLGVLARGKLQVGLTRGIVDQVQEAADRTPPFKPVVGRAVKLHEFALGRTAWTFAPVRAFLALKVGAACSHQPAADRLVVDGNLMSFGEYLAEQGGSVVTVLSPVQLQNALFELEAVAIVGGAAPKPVNEAGIAAGVIALQKPEDMASAE